MFGDAGNDISIWAGGDGSDAFQGGPGLDALVLATVDRDGIIPLLTDPVPGFPHGTPTANATGQNGFCTLEQIPGGSSLGNGLVFHQWMPARSIYFSDPDGHELELCAPLKTE